MSNKAAVILGGLLLLAFFWVRWYSSPSAPLIGQKKPPAAVVALSEITSINEVKLEGIADQVSGNKSAVINGELVKEGFKAGEVEIKKITKNSVSLTIIGKEYTINLPEEGGGEK